MCFNVLRSALVQGTKTVVNHIQNLQENQTQLIESTKQPIFKVKCVTRWTSKDATKLWFADGALAAAADVDLTLDPEGIWMGGFHGWKIAGGEETWPCSMTKARIWIYPMTPLITQTKLCLAPPTIALLVHVT